MKKIIVLFAVVLVAVSCKQNAKSTEKKEVSTPEPNYPEALAKVLKKHGGIAAWRKAKTLSFNLGEEKHTTDLHTRQSLIQNPNYSLGFDGEKIWVSDTLKFKGNAEFYHNLYFYFYAMPFVLADDGIVYGETPALTFEGKSYPGIKISYNSGVGASPEDNYFLYYNPDTYQMEWLGYTVTYYSKKTSDRVNIIRYNNWETVNGLLLPKSITWYKKDEKGAPAEPTKPVEFTKVTVSEKGESSNFYAPKK